MAVNMSIAALKNKITAAGGLQRENRFLVVINSDSFATGNDNDSANGGKKSYYAESVLFPNVSLITQSDGLAGPGPGRTVPRGLSYRGGVMITFPVFGDLEFLQGMNDWMKKYLYIREGNLWYTDFYEESVRGANSTMTVDLLSVNGEVTGTYSFEEVFPVEIAPIELSTAKNNSYMTITVRFAFREYSFEKADL